MTVELCVVALMLRWLFLQELIPMLWLWIRTIQRRDHLKDPQSPLRKLDIYTLIVKSQLLNQFQVECIWMYKPSHIRKFLLINQLKESKELQLNSIWIDLQYHFSSQRCHQKKIVKLPKFMKEIMNFSISMKKLNQC